MYNDDCFNDLPLGVLPVGGLPSKVMFTLPLDPDCLYGILAVFSVSSSGNPSRHHFLIILLLKHLIKQILCQ